MPNVPKHLLPDQPDKNILDFDFVRPLFSSQPNGWENVQAFMAQLLPNEESPLTTMLQDGFNIQMNGVVNLEYRSTGRWSQARAYPGGICLVPRNTQAQFRWTGVSPIHCLYLYFPETVMTDVVQEMGRGDPLHVETIPAFNFHDPLVEQIALALVGELQSPGLAGRLYAEALGQTLLIHMLRNHSSLAARTATVAYTLSQQQVNRAQEYIHAHLSEDISLAHLASSVSLSPSHFSRLFKQATGVSPHQYVIQQRVERARSLLISGGKSVGEVAYEVGFYDQSHLHHHFKRLVGISPAAIIPESKKLQ
jgi:AraC family transcriptional regulator